MKMDVFLMLEILKGNAKNNDEIMYHAKLLEEKGYLKIDGTKLILTSKANSILIYINFENNLSKAKDIVKGKGGYISFRNLILLLEKLYNNYKEEQK